MRARAAAPTPSTCHAQVGPTERRMSHPRHPLQSRSLRYEGKVSLEDALKRSAALRDRILARFVEVHDAVRPTAEEPPRRYLSNLTCLIHGNYEWGVRADRYTNPDGHHPGAVRVTGTVTTTPGVTGAPPGIPWTGWWWDCR
jgi:hypothetical protein